MTAVADVRRQTPSWLGSPLDPVEDLRTLTHLARNDLKAREATLAQLLLDAGVVDSVTMRELPIDDDALVVALEERGVLSPTLAERWLAWRSGIPSVLLAQFDVDESACRLIPEHLARKHRLLPLALIDEVLFVAVANHRDYEVFRYLEFVSGHRVELTLADREEIEFALARFYGPADDRAVLESVPCEPEPAEDQQALERLGHARPTVRLVQNIIDDAIASRASDIHLRPLDHEVALYFRIDGQLVRMRSFEKSALAPVVSRIKIMGGMNISERRLPQDGRARVRRGDRDIDLRVSVIPSVRGESVVIRILDTSTGLRSLDQIGFSDADHDTFRELVEKPHGLLLVTGPTGSGKSTTLYAALQDVSRRNVNIITVEDPVEYRLEGITQIQVNPAVGYDFARALRHILRHDPDVVMVGEMRDIETTEMAIQSALTGHLVLSTLHTNSAAATLVRLLDIGVEPYLVSATLLGVLAQRLVRRNCSHCSVPEPVDPHVRRALGVSDNEPFSRGAGCEQCHHTGYRGRIAVYELLPVTAELRAQMQAGVSIDALERTAINGGMVPLTARAMQLARDGITSLEEVYRTRLD